MAKRLLFIEDDPVIRENYVELLSDSGFEVEAFGDRHAALSHLQTSMPDLAVLDISLESERDAGFQLCADLRRLSPQLPIVFLTCRDNEVDRISGIRLGVDDYLTKDVSPDYLVVRLEALLRRFESLTGESRPSQSQSRLRKGLLTIDLDCGLVYWQDQKVELSLVQYRLVQSLAANPGQAKNYAALMKAAAIHVEPNTIAAHIKAIRAAFKAIDPAFDCIKTERGSGYRWLDAERAQDAEAPTDTGSRTSEMTTKLALPGSPIGGRVWPNTL